MKTGIPHEYWIGMEDLSKVSISCKTSEGRQSITSKKKTKNDSILQFLEGAWPCQQWDFDVLTSKTVRQ